MDPEEMEEWRTIFNLFDVDGDESITCEVNLTAMAPVDGTQQQSHIKAGDIGNILIDIIAIKESITIN